MEPMDIPIMAGAIMDERFASIAAMGSSGVSGDSSRRLSAVARFVKSGRRSVRVRWAHFARVVVRIST